MDETENITNVAKEVVTKNATDAMYGVTDIPYHVHTGVDSPQVSANDLLDLVTAWSKQIYVADTSSNDTYVVAMKPAPSQYFTGLQVNFKATTANTGAATLNVNGLGAKTITKIVSQSLEDNDILAGQIVTVIYDGTNFQMQSQTATRYIPLATGTTKGDLIGYSASSIVGRIGVGTNGTVLTADSTQTLGVKWGSSITPYVFGVATGYSTNASANDGNHDETITTTFTPTMIKLYYFLQGHTRNSASNKYEGRKGISVWNGTTLVFDFPIWGDAGNLGNGVTMTGSNGVPTGTVDANVVTFPNYPNGTGSGSNSLIVGDTGFTGDAQITLSIASVSSTSFVIRLATVVADVAGNTALGIISYEAWA